MGRLPLLRANVAEMNNKTSGIKQAGELHLCQCGNVGEMNNNINRQVRTKSRSLEKVRDEKTKLVAGFYLK